MNKDNTRHNYNILNSNFFNTSVLKDDTAPEQFVAVSTSLQAQTNTTPRKKIYTTAKLSFAVLCKH